MTTKKLRRRAASLLLLAGLAVCACAFANAAEPPCLTVLVSNAPSTLTLQLQFPGGAQLEPIPLTRQQKGWETYYRFYYHMAPFARQNVQQAVLVADDGANRLEFALDAQALESYNNLFTLDLDTQTLLSGQPALRVPLLVLLRVALTLMIESAVFALFGYRSRRSWTIFLLVNLVTQGAINALLTGPSLGGYWVIGYAFGELLIFIGEALAFACLVQEKGRGRAVLCALAANTASLIAGGWLIAQLPV